MSAFSFRRRLNRGASSSAKLASSSSPPPPQPPPAHACACNELLAHRPLRVFCIPCVFVVPPVQCHCAPPLNHPVPESSAAAAPLHVSASTTLTPANAPASNLPAQSFMPPHAAPPRQPARNAEQPPASHRRAQPTAAHGSADVNALSSLAPSSFLHDLNANMTVVLNLNDPSTALPPTTAFAPEAQIHTGRALTAVQPNVALNAARSEAEPSSPRSYSSSESRDVLDDDSDITQETSYDSLVKQLQQTSPEAFSRALHAVKAADLSADSRNKLMHALENALQTLCIEQTDHVSLPHSNIRIEAYTALASFYATTTCPQNNKVIEYCQLGLDLAAGRERLFPQLVANLHALKARVLVSIGDMSRIQEAISHAKAAQVALYAIRDPKLHYELCVTLGDAYTVLMDGAVCDNIYTAYEWYRAAIELSKMTASESPIKVMWLSCRTAQLILRYLRQKRSGQNMKENEQHGGKKVGATCSMSISNLLTIVEQLRIDVEKVREKVRESEMNVSDELRRLESVVFECIGKAYFERARTSSTKVQDLKKAASSMHKALSLSLCEADPCGHRYAGIQEMIDDVQSQLKTAEASNQMKRR